ncbi:MAG: hypothetical protein BAJALOKI2v1_20061 [Promethearchaeota archaeon]|nr:MAG: hypothetical protein BAJALOKI2v1_20061 [Candidatus Lokiarchaeota archaeon]
MYIKNCKNKFFLIKKVKFVLIKNLSREVLVIKNRYKTRKLVDFRFL